MRTGWMDSERTGTKSVFHRKGRSATKPQPKDKTFAPRRGETARRGRNQKTRPLHHGGTEARRRTKNKWVLVEPLIPGCVQNPGPGYFSFLSPAEKLRTRKF